MTAILPNIADPVGQLTPAQHGNRLATVLDHITSDAARFGLRPIDVTAHLEFDFCSAAVQLVGGDTAGVDALAGAYGLPPADPEGGLYGRQGPAVFDGQQVTVLVYCGRPVEAGPDAQPALPPVPQSPAVDASVAPAVDGGPQPLQVAAVRVDTPSVPA